MTRRTRATMDLPFSLTAVPPGDSARSFLDDRRFAVVRFEVEYMEGYEPTAEALDSLQTTLDTYLNKSSIQISIPTQIPAQDGE